LFSLFKLHSRLLRIAILTLICAAAVPSGRADDWKILINPANSFAFDILNGDKPVLRPGTGGWGPNWAWFSLNSQQRANGDELNISTTMAIGHQKPTIALKVHATEPNTVVFEYDLQAQNDVPILMITSTIGVPEGGHAHVVFSHPDGSQVSTDLPMNPKDFGVISKIEVTSDAWAGPLFATLDPPISVGGHGEVRMALAANTLKAGSTKETITWTFPQECTLLFKQADVEKYAPVLTTPDWFAYEPKWSKGKSAIGAEDFLDKPAGKHGGVRLHGDQFQFQDGTPVKFWGMNLAYGLSAPEKTDGEAAAARFAKYGVNAIRMHKFMGAGWEGIGDPNDSTKTEPRLLDKLDYFANELTKNGVYYGWSHTFALKLKPGDRNRVAGYDEIMKKGGSTYAVINFAEDIQDLMIESVVNLLKHKNPYTGKVYAEDPALSYIELQNEDDIFFYTTTTAIANFPTYRKLLQEHFSQWLTTKYGSQDKLATAWEGAIKENETLADNSIAIQGVPWEMSDAHLPQTKGGTRQRLLDTAAFLHFTQDKFYNKFVKAIRDAGYQGPLVGSPWQAPAMLPLYYNLASDNAVGYIDRHNYFGGGFSDTMLNTPGGGFFSSGLQQVINKPFGISEWIDCYPSLYSAEGPVIMAAYGLGLQGWGASYEFQSTIKPQQANKAIVGQEPYGVWNGDVPTQIGQYPILARMLMRGDIKTAPIISVRRVSRQDLENGDFNFSDKLKQEGDVKVFTGQVPAESLAAGRDVVEFVDKSAPSTFPDMTKYKDGNVITSATGQLKWDSGDGVITINTPGTQGYVGFAHGKNMVLGDVSIRPTTPYASILITAADLKNNLANDSRVLISAIARNSNNGFRMLTLDNKTIVDNGKGPVMLEPVKADIAFAKRTIKQVNILDHDGNESGRTLPTDGGKFTIDSAADHAIYYEVIFGQ
jgi:hypothetical protein